MSYQVLARKWRPQVFEDVIGQEHITQTLANAIKNDRLAHAYLFGGPRGIGKTSVARILAKAINCRNGEPGIPCNKCTSCVEITDGSSTDVQEIDGASNRGIDEIRALRDNVKYMPSSSEYRIYIIDEVHMLTLPAFNALLKTLEEPPAHVKFIFATTETHKVPMTILSRCQRFDFKKIPPALIVSHLENIIRKEHIQIEKSGIALIAKEADGCMRDAQSLLDQVISFAGEKTEAHHIREVLGIIDRDIVFDACRAIIENSPGKCFEIVDQVYNYGHDIKEFYRDLMCLLRDLMIVDLGSYDHMLEMSDSEKEAAKTLAAQAGSEKIRMLLNFLISREQELRYGSDPRLILEATMVKLCSMGDYLSFGDLLEKIGDLEKNLPAGGETHSERISDPGGGWASTETKKVKVKHEIKDETTYDRNLKNDWDDFLGFVKSKSRSLSNVLKNWQFISLADETLKIAKGVNMPPFSAGFFEDKENLERLSGYCRKFFKKDIQIVLLAENNSETEKIPAPDAKGPAEKAKKQTGYSKPVQDVLRVFQGEIEEGHPKE